MMRRRTLLRLKGNKMQDTPIHCPAPEDASDAEKLACEADNDEAQMQTLDSGPTSPAPTPTPKPTKPKG